MTQNTSSGQQCSPDLNNSHAPWASDLLVSTALGVSGTKVLELGSGASAATIWAGRAGAPGRRDHMSGKQQHGYKTRGSADNSLVNRLSQQHRSSIRRRRLPTRARQLHSALNARAAPCRHQLLLLLLHDPYSHASDTMAQRGAPAESTGIITRVKPRLCVFLPALVTLKSSFWPAAAKVTHTAQAAKNLDHGLWLALLLCASPPNTSKRPQYAAQQHFRQQPT